MVAPVWLGLDAFPSETQRLARGKEGVDVIKLWEENYNSLWCACLVL